MKQAQFGVVPVTIKNLTGGFIMVNQQHYFARRLLKKSLSVTLASTMLLGMVTIGNVFGPKASAAEMWSEGD